MKTSVHHLWRSVLVVIVLAVVAIAPGSLLAAPSAQENAEYALDSLLVRFDPATPAFLRAQARREVGAELEMAYTLVPGLEKLRLRNPAMDVGQAIEQLRRQPNVLYVEPDYTVYANMDPDGDSNGTSIIVSQ